MLSVEFDAFVRFAFEPEQRIECQFDVVQTKPQTRREQNVNNASVELNGALPIPRICRGTRNTKAIFSFVSFSISATCMSFAAAVDHGWTFNPAVRMATPPA